MNNKRYLPTLKRVKPVMRVRRGNQASGKRQLPPSDLSRLDNVRFGSFKHAHSLNLIKSSCNSFTISSGLLAQGLCPHSSSFTTHCTPLFSTNMSCRNGGSAWSIVQFTNAILPAKSGSFQLDAGAGDSNARIAWGLREASISFAIGAGTSLKRNLFGFSTVERPGGRLLKEKRRTIGLVSGRARFDHRIGMESDAQSL